MNPDSWQQIDRLLDEALGRKPEEHSAFLDKACAAGPDLRRDLLRQFRLSCSRASDVPAARPCTQIDEAGSDLMLVENFP